MTSSFLRPGWRKYNLAPLSRSGRSGPLQDKNPARPNHTDFMACDYNIEQINRELKSDLGMGEHQVSQDERRIEKSFGIAVMAYLFLIRICRDDLRPGQSWSLMHLQHVFRLRVITNQVEHNVKTRLSNSRKAA
jgi:hypothetical protein